MRTCRQIVFKIVYPIFFFILFSISLNSRGQANLKEIRVQGGNIQFVYNTMSKYLNGIDLVGVSKLSFRFNVTGSSGWELKLKSSNNTIVSDDGNPDIPIADLQIEVSSSTFSNDLNTTFNPIFSLSNTYSTFVQGDGGIGNPDVVLGEIIFTFKLPSMLNKHEGFYSVDLEFLLVEK